MTFLLFDILHSAIPLKASGHFFVEKCRENYTSHLHLQLLWATSVACPSVEGDCAEPSIQTRISTSCLHFSFLLISFFPFSSLLQASRLAKGIHTLWARKPVVPVTGSSLAPGCYNDFFLKGSRTHWILS